MLLATLLIALVVQSLRIGSGIASVALDVLITVLGVLILIVVFDPRERWLAGPIFVVMLVAGWSRYLVSATALERLSLAYQLLSATFMAYAVTVILRTLLRAPAVGAENVTGAICGYLIAGNAWTNVNVLAYLTVPAAYHVDPGVASLLAEWHGRTALFSYYSFAQLMTIGYSDVTPVRPPATTLSLLGALFGVFYTAVVVSQLVGMARSENAKQ